MRVVLHAYHSCASQIIVIQPFILLVMLKSRVRNAQPPITRLSRIERVLTRFEAIDLGQVSDYGGIGCCGSAKDAKKTYYPGIYVSNLKKDPGDIPMEGTATIKYRLTGRRMNESKPGEPRYGFDLDVLSFDPVGKKEGKAVKDKDKNLENGKAVKMEMAARLGKVTQFGLDPRTRDGQGQFVAAQTGGADPVTMRQAYGNPLLKAGAAAAALGGAGLALGATKRGRGLLGRLKQRLGGRA